jgi:hypothetical protein
LRRRLESCARRSTFDRRNTKGESTGNPADPGARTPQTMTIEFNTNAFVYANSAR